jgi:hypoxanthine phosphoribosyltransferase
LEEAVSEPFVEVVASDALSERVAQLAADLRADLEGEVPVVVGILQGSVPFLADLVRGLDPRLEVDFMALTRFGMDGRIGISMDTSIPLEDRHVVIVEDIVDTGLTLASLLRLIEVRGPASLRTVALIDKSARRIVDVPIEHRGFEVGDEFLIGYGMDWEGKYRNLKSLWGVMDMSVLVQQPEAFDEVAFPRA